MRWSPDTVRAYCAARCGPSTTASISAAGGCPPRRPSGSRWSPPTRPRPIGSTPCATDAGRGPCRRPGPARLRPDAVAAPAPGRTGRGGGPRPPRLPGADSRDDRDRHRRNGFAPLVRRAGAGPRRRRHAVDVPRCGQARSSGRRRGGVTTPARSSAASRSAWWVPSRRGTSRSSSSCRNWLLRSWPGARWWSRPRPSHRSMRCCWPRSSHEAELPEGVVSILVGGREAGEHLVRHPDVDKIAFTGSSAVGPAHRGHLRRAPGQVQPGARGQVRRHRARRRRSGAHRRRASSSRPSSTAGRPAWPRRACSPPGGATHEAVDALASMVEGIAVGDPGDPATYVGPLVARRQQERVHRLPPAGGRGRRAHGGRRRRRGPPASAPAGTWRRRSWPTSTTPWPWRGKRSSGRRVRDPLRRRGRRRAHRERLPLRVGRLGVVQGPGPRRRGGTQDAHRHGGHQRVRARPVVPLRRLQAERHRPRIRAGRPGGLPRVQVDLRAP